jgi:flagellar motility protein MotE (MotC chaperone)
LLISGFFLASIVLRLIGEEGQAFARGVQLPTLSGHQSSETDPPEPHADATTPDPGAISALVEALKQREAQLAKREKALANRLQALAVAEAAINRNMEDLIAAETALKSTMALASTAAEDDLARLTSVYENMKPKDAAAVFEEMAPEFAAGFLGRMRPDAAALVMAGLSPTRAYSISVILAGRNASVPTE